ncbi:FHA domain-containing protein [Agaribacterium haliotis]|uniref:FHA domain-containing protein n=1 Tax=Agaribacterium haliotis TaxID=2013869 RepID=UPI000BB55B13|nr:FHA domain-containing protein [Agaribacterium haliotis]
MPFLKHSVNGATVNIVELASPVRFGRAADNNLILDDPTVSQYHAELVERDGQWLLQDCDSTNGLFVEGERSSGARLQHGSVFRMGAQSFEFLNDVPSALEQTLRIKKSWIPGVYYTE